LETHRASKPGGGKNDQKETYLKTLEVQREREDHSGGPVGGRKTA
jgi:hypothetical protein